MPELCDSIAHHLDKQSLAAVVRVSTLWHSTWIRHLWRRVRVEAGTTKSSDMAQAFPRLGRHIRQLDWIDLSDSTITSNSILRDADLSSLNLHSLLLANWSSELNATTLSRFVESSTHRLSALQLHNLTTIRGDLLKVAGSLRNLRHFSLVMAGEDSRHNHHHQRSNGSVSSPNSPTVLSSPTDGAELAEFTSADSLPALMDACPRLKTIELLDLRSPSTVETTTLEAQDATATPTDSDTVCPSIEHVALNWMPMQYLTLINLHETAISGSTLSTLFARSLQLTKLNLGQSSPLYLTGLKLDPLLSMTALTTLMFAGCHFLDGHGFKEIFKASPNLLSLDIPKTNVDDAALGVLGHQCSRLTDLNLDGCQQITDQGVRDMLSNPPVAKVNGIRNPSSINLTVQQGPYQNYTLHCLSVTDCTELTGQGIHHILMTCAGLRSLEVQQPELLPESLFPHTLESDQDQDIESPSAPASESTTIYPTTESGIEIEDTIGGGSTSLSWACRSTLELLRIKNLNFLNPEQTQFLNARLRELSQLKVLHIGGNQLELSVLNGLGHQLENLYIDALVREVGMEDVRWLVDHTPNLTRLWCRQLIRHSEPWKLLRSARKHLKLW
ncbi:hypothetical protein BGZ54_000234 [Gamsiella multidivaricata]|nr:hypothetical protein BGZ54_000234 [Gamsiella multidivaricata]